MQTGPRPAAALAEGPLNEDELKKLHAYWRAANYLSVGQIYLLNNPLLREPLQVKHIKPRLLGHWGTTPGLNFLYAHMNRVIKARDLDAIFICGPGHGGRHCRHGELAARGGDDDGRGGPRDAAVPRRQQPECLGDVIAG